jgi:hypothetical protein
MPHAARESLVVQLNRCGLEVRWLDVAKRGDAKSPGCQLAIASTAGVSAGSKGVSRLRVDDKERATRSCGMEWNLARFEASCVQKERTGGLAEKSRQLVHHARRDADILVLRSLTDEP